MSTVLNNKAVLTMSTSSSCLYVNYCSWVNWPQHPFTLKIHQKSKKMWFVNVSVVINSFFLDYGHNVSHLIFSSFYFRDTLSLPLRHFIFAIFLYREINVWRKFHVICNCITRTTERSLLQLFSVFVVAVYKWMIEEVRDWINKMNWINREESN